MAEAVPVKVWVYMVLAAAGYREWRAGALAPGFWLMTADC
jgi:hypothetical protein